MSHTPRPRFVLPHEQLTLSICRSVDGSMAASAGSSHASGFVSRRSGSALEAVESWPVETSLSVHLLLRTAWGGVYSRTPPVIRSSRKLHRFTWLRLPSMARTR